MGQRGSYDCMIEIDLNWDLSKGVPWLGRIIRRVPANTLREAWLKGAFVHRYNITQHFQSRVAVIHITYYAVFNSTLARKQRCFQMTKGTPTVQEHWLNRWKRLIVRTSLNWLGWSQLKRLIFVGLISGHQARFQEGVSQMWTHWMQHSTVMSLPHIVFVMRSPHEDPATVLAKYNKRIQHKPPSMFLGKPCIGFDLKTWDVHSPKYRIPTQSKSVTLISLDWGSRLMTNLAYRLRGWMLVFNLVAQCIIWAGSHQMSGRQ